MIATPVVSSDGPMIIGAVTAVTGACLCMPVLPFRHARDCRKLQRCELILLYHDRLLLVDDHRICLTACLYIQAQ